MATLVNVAYIAVKPNWIVTTTARAVCHMRHTWQGEEKGIGRVFARRKYFRILLAKGSFGSLNQPDMVSTWL